MIKKLMSALGLASGILIAQPACAIAVCANNVYINSLEFGNVLNPPAGGMDGGAAVAVTFSNGVRLSLNTSMNGNDAIGTPMIAALRMAFVWQLRVTVWDNYGSNCDDFDVITVSW